MSKVSSLVGVLMLSAACVGCGDDDGMSGTPPPQPPPPPDGGTPPPPPGVEAEWTVFVYGHADHNLSNSLVRDIQEMNRATIPDDMNVIVLADFDASQDIGDGGEKFPSGSALLRIVGGGAEPEELGTGEEEDLDSPDVLAGYVQDIFTQFPARRRGLIMWNHGGGWSGGFGGDTQDGTREGTSLPFQDAADAIASGLSSAGITEEPPLVFLSFDTCLMAGAEIAYSFRTIAELYVANAEIDYGDGWDYERALTMIGEQKGIAADDLGREEVSIWDAHHASAGVNDGLLRSHVAVDLAQIDAFATAMSALSDVWLASEALDPADVGLSGFYALPPYYNQIESGSTNPGLRDLGQFLDRLGTTTSDPAVASAASAARSSLDSIVIDSSQGSVRTAGRQSGVHTELSLASQLTPMRRADFRAVASDWSQATGWADVLDLLASYDDAQVPKIDHALAPDGSATVVFSSTDGDVAEAGVFVAQAQGPQVVFLGLVGTGAIEPSSEYQLAWDGRLAALPTADGGQQLVTLLPWMTIGTDAASGDPVPGILSVPGILTIGDEEVEAALLVGEDETTGVVIVVPEPANTFLISDLDRDFDGATFTPVLITIDPATDATGSQRGEAIALDGITGIEVGAVDAGAGDYFLITTMTDVWGNESAEADAITLAP